jgi:1,4-alpha-glucan branching enzyme
MRAAFGRFLEDLGALYVGSRALWASEPDPATFSWIDAADVEASVISYLRRGAGEVLAVIANLTPVVRYGYRIGLPAAGPWEEVLNTDSGFYGGSNVGNLGVLMAEPTSQHGQPASTHLTLPPLATLVLRLARGSSVEPAA